MSVSLSEILICYLVQLDLLKRWIDYCFKRGYSKYIQASTNDACCEISALFRKAILKNKLGQLLHYYLFSPVRLID